MPTMLESVVLAVRYVPPSVSTILTMRLCVGDSSHECSRMRKCTTFLCANRFITSGAANTVSRDPATPLVWERLQTCSSGMPKTLHEPSPKRTLMPLLSWICAICAVV